MATFWEITARCVCQFFSLSFVYLFLYLIPVLVLGAGFGFCLLQFLFIAFLLIVLNRLTTRHTDSFTGSPPFLRDIIFISRKHRLLFFIYSYEDAFLMNDLRTIVDPLARLFNKK